MPLATGLPAALRPSHVTSNRIRPPARGPNSLSPDEYRRWQKKSTGGFLCWGTAKVEGTSRVCRVLAGAERVGVVGFEQGGEGGWLVGIG